MTKNPYHHNSKYILSILIQLKTGESLPSLAEKLGVSYHSLFKVVQKSSNRENRKTRSILAEFLGVDYDVLWGPESDQKIKKMVEEEILRVTISHAFQFHKTLREQTIGRED